MKQKSVWFLVLGLSLLTMGMGGLGGQETVQIPDPQYNYRAILVDQADVSMTLEKLSWEGQTYLTGTLGKAEVSIDFEKIGAILFVLQGSRLTARVTLKDGQTTELVVDPKKFVYGVSSFADVKIATLDIKTITLQGKVD